MGRSLLLLCFISLFGTGESRGSDPAPEPRVIGGIVSGNSELPWQAYLNMTYRTNGTVRTFICGGVVISPDVVVTAAHCLRNDGETVSVNDIEVWAGITSIFSASASNAVSVRELVIHPSYNAFRFANDIAILKLSSALPDTVVPIQVATTDEQFDADLAFNSGWVDNGERIANLLVSGWGSTDPSDPNSGSTRLRQTLLSGVPDFRCDSLWGSNITGLDYPIYLCAGSTSPDLARDSCFGDSGGPLVWQNPQRAGDSDFGLRLVGLVSFGEGCAGRLPGVYTETATYRDWIAAEAGESIFGQPTPSFKVNPFEADYPAENEEGVTTITIDNTGGDSGGGSLSWWWLCAVGWLALYCRRRVVPASSLQQ